MTSDTTCLAAGVYSSLQVQNVGSGNAIACKWGAAASLNDKGSFMLDQYRPAFWSRALGGVPNATLHCIAATATTPLYVETIK